MNINTFIRCWHWRKFKSKCIILNLKIQIQIHKECLILIWWGTIFITILSFNVEFGKIQIEIHFCQFEDKTPTQIYDKCIILDQECKSQFPYQSFHSMLRLEKVSADVGNIKSSMLMNGWLKCWSQNVYLHNKNWSRVMV